MNHQEELQMIAMPQPFMHVVENGNHNRAEIHLRGEFKSPQESTQQLTELYNLAEKYNICLVYINSNGGQVDTLMELVNVLKKFDRVITVVTSNAASAGIMLWATGDVRVVCPHAELMAHRETSGYIDKTDGIIDRASFLKRRFEKLFVDLCGDVLTVEEIDRARNGEVWLLGQDLIDRGVAISWDQFHTLDCSPVETLPLVIRGDKYFIDANGVYLEAHLDIIEDCAYDSLDILYDLPEKKNVLSCLVDGVLIESESELRETIVGVVGKGNYQLIKRKDEVTLSVRHNGKMVGVFCHDYEEDGDLYPVSQQLIISMIETALSEEE